MNFGHWELTASQVVEFQNYSKLFGFTYKITNLVTGKKYIGCKQFRICKDKKENWKYYTGSSKLLNEDIKTLGFRNFSFEILNFYKTKKELKLGEALEILQNDCLNLKEYYNECLTITEVCKKVK